jgi:DNA-binding FrmR family transcriptional regulator
MLDGLGSWSVEPERLAANWLTKIDVMPGRPVICSCLARLRAIGDPMRYIGVGGIGMSHIHEHKDDLIKRVRRIAGQVEAVERALESDADCAKTLHLVAAIRGAVNGLLEQFIDAHAREHVAHPGLSDAERAQGVEDLLLAIRRYAK